jgi:hypothetical protein
MPFVVKIGDGIVNNSLKSKFHLSSRKKCEEEMGRCVAVSCCAGSVLHMRPAG